MNRLIYGVVGLLLLSHPTFAETTAQSDPSAAKASEWVEETPPKTTINRVQLGKFGAAKVKIEDFEGEPVGSGVEISVELNCGKKRFQLVEPTLRACEFKEAIFDAKTNRLILKFKITEMVQGRHNCVKDDSYDFPLTAHCRK